MDHSNMIIARGTLILFPISSACSPLSLTVLTCPHSCLTILFILSALTHTSDSVLRSNIHTLIFGTFVLCLCSFATHPVNSTAQLSRPSKKHKVNSVTRPGPDQLLSRPKVSFDLVFTFPRMQR